MHMQALDKGTKVVGLSKDLQEGVLFMCGLIPNGSIQKQCTHQSLCCHVFLRAYIVSQGLILKSRLCNAHRTYHTLISPGKGKSRLEQVIYWVGGPDFDGVVVFDEAHKVL